MTPGDHRLTVTCDITDHAHVAALMAAADARFGRIDVLMVDPAGAGGAGPGDPPSHELLRETVRMQLLGLWNCVREAGARMLPRGAGAVIVVTSAPGRGDDPFFPPAHRATAAALEGMTRNLALSWAGRGVRVNALAPGIGDPGALVGPLRFLAGEASRHVNGHTLVVDDGASVGLGHTRADDHAYEFHAVPPPDEVGGHPFWPG
ncbi:MAG: SDR family oxidoreductase [Thermoleophilia bacterium]